jgi:ATP-binding cassette subfamily B protein RaxB
VGNDGSALSGGQVQRVMIARAVYKGAKILVLDEATSHLDMETEKKINEALRGLKVARVIVAHRPSSIVQADKIYSLTGTGLKEVGKERFRSVAAAT